MGSYVLPMQVPADDASEEQRGPKIDFSHSGQKKLDLGFGRWPTQAHGSRQISWERLRKVTGRNIFCLSQEGRVILNCG
jgi:hypothetical protein